MRRFLRLNGYDLAIEDEVEWERPIVELIERVISEENLVRVISPLVRDRSTLIPC